MHASRVAAMVVGFPAVLLYDTRVAAQLEDIRRFLSAPTPIIQRIDPAYGAPGILVEIAGEHLLSAQPPIVSVRGSVRFGTAAAEVKSWANRKIEVVVPPGKGTVPVSVGGGNVLDFTYVAPKIDQVIPACGGQNEQVRIIGKDFGRRQLLEIGSRVTFGKSLAPVVSWDEHEIVVEAPSDFGTGVNDQKLLADIVGFALGGNWALLAKIILKLAIPEVALAPSGEGIKVDVRVVTAGGNESAVVPYQYLGCSGVVAAPITPPDVGVARPGGLGPGPVNACYDRGGTHATLATALALDVSGSMNEPSGRPAERKIDAVMLATTAYIQGVQPSDHLSLSTFATMGATLVPMVTQHDGRKTLLDQASRLSAQGNTNMRAGLEMASKELDGSKVSGARKVALLMSDGIHNVGPWSDVTAIARAFAEKKPRWRIYTLGFGQNVDELKMRELAEMTAGRYFPAEADNIVQVYGWIKTDASGESTVMSFSELLAPGGQLNYTVVISPDAACKQVRTDWQGSRLETTLVSPSGRIIRAAHLTGDRGRYAEGKTYQMLEVRRPEPGIWQIQLRWAEPPARAERVNISVSEKTDVVANILGFKSWYRPGERVPIAVRAVEVLGGEDSPLRNGRVVVKIRKPGPEIVQAVQAGTGIWVMYKDVVQDNTRELVLHDDGRHDDNRAGDGIYGNAFAETDLNGPYVVTVEITGSRGNGEKVTRILQGSFQVGPIALNRITISRELDWLQKLAAGAKDLRQEVQDRPKQPAKETENLLEQPAKETEDLLGDPQKQIQKLLGN
jgi:hypothetical protein